MADLAPTKQHPKGVPGCCSFRNPENLTSAKTMMMEQRKLMMQTARP